MGFGKSFFESLLNGRKSFNRRIEGWKGFSQMKGEFMSSDPSKLLQLKTFLLEAE